ncbi:MAG: hypothetical protein IKZ87_00815 [Actinomycetaceae bacterium]|nr:hypothetical protein [Actinomycetaceae bacterium]
MMHVTRALFKGTAPERCSVSTRARIPELQNAMHGTALAMIFWLALPANTAFAADPDPTIVTMLINVGKHIQPFIVLAQVIAAAIGAYFVFDGLVELWAVNDDRALKYLRGRDRFSNGSALVSILLGGIFIAISDLSLMGALSRTLAGSDTVVVNDATKNVGVRWEWVESYNAAASSNDLTLKTQVAAHTLLGIMQIIGISAVIRGWLTLNAYYNQRHNAGLGTAFGWIIGGIIAWNLNWFGKTLNETFGFKLFWFFDFT